MSEGKAYDLLIANLIASEVKEQEQEELIVDLKLSQEQQVQEDTIKTQGIASKGVHHFAVKCLIKVTYLMKQLQ